MTRTILQSITLRSHTDTRSVRRTSGFVQVAISEKWRAYALAALIFADLRRAAGSYPVTSRRTACRLSLPQSSRYAHRIYPAHYDLHF